MTGHDATSLPIRETASTFPLPVKHWKAICRAMGLSGQQARVVELVLHDLGDKEIAEEMGLRLGTVKDYLARIGRQTGTSGRVQLLIYLLRISHHLLANPEADSKRMYQ